MSSFSRASVIAAQAEYDLAVLVQAAAAGGIEAAAAADAAAPAAAPAAKPSSGRAPIGAVLRTGPGKGAVAPTSSSEGPVTDVAAPQTTDIVPAYEHRSAPPEGPLTDNHALAIRRPDLPVGLPNGQNSTMKAYEAVAGHPAPASIALIPSSDAANSYYETVKETMARHPNNKVGHAPPTAGPASPLAHADATRLLLSRWPEHERFSAMPSTRRGMDTSP